MKVLLDTHALIWAVGEPARLGSSAAATLQEPSNELLLSAGTTWEIAIKMSLNKLTLSLPFGRWLQLQIGGDRRSSSSPGLIVMDLSRSACRARLSFLQALCGFFRRDLRPGSCAKRECKPNHESLHVRLPVDRPARPNTPGTGIPPLSAGPSAVAVAAGEDQLVTR